MKFLTICKVKDSFTMVPPTTARQLMEASLAWTNEHKRTGEILEVYEMTGGGTMTICEHSNIEEFQERLASIPMSVFMDFKVYPLADFNSAMKNYIEAIKKAENLMPVGAR